MAEKYQQLIKLILVGDSGTGKSSLLHRFVEDDFSEQQAQTIGVEFGSKIVQLAGRKVKLQIWDTAGQERYKSVTRSYYRSAIGCLIVYDITQRSTYESVPQWLNDVRHLAGKDVVVMLIGNKSDLSDCRQVQHNEASLYALENGLLHFETSAASGEFVSESFLKVAKMGLSMTTEDVSIGENRLLDVPADQNPGNVYSCVC
ncbi:ras-related rab-4 [Trypanosoma rangeli]|uniref:Ras-related rab-4 n=1 Tax=Trypanosoma rangeli TaxID=5698 RepID=A0A3R7KD28_TRYRA|nr:ras-related rab-4 [Trypanosoma rangeli]RNF05655.1 ras-related rab-4 [Trypanosoma rangeli]|eukprot:RNF05655.1 ras-related rab-4 [Trypanosoma rangeli]